MVQVWAVNRLIIFTEIAKSEGAGGLAYLTYMSKYQTPEGDIMQFSAYKNSENMMEGGYIKSPIP